MYQLFFANLSSARLKSLVFHLSIVTTRWCCTCWIATVMVMMAVWVSANPSGHRSTSGMASTWHVALDGSGQFTGIQEAIDHAASGDTIMIKAGTYAEDVTVHSKEGLTIIGEGIDWVWLTGEKRVGTLHIGKWPYGATNVTIRGLTVIQHGGLGVGIFNGSGVFLQQVRVQGMVFSQQVEDVKIQDCIIEHSETTGVAFADSTGVLIGNAIRHNDHGIALGGHSDVILQKNVISHSLYEAVLMTDNSKAMVRQNTFVRNGGGMAFHDKTIATLEGNIISHSDVGLLFAQESQTSLEFNALYANQANYLLQGTPHSPIPQRAGKTDLAVAPGFVNLQEGDFRLRHDSALRDVEKFSYLGALPPVISQD